jgi:uridine phosphorylase
MARREFQQFEAVSAVVPGEGGYSAAIAVKELGAAGAPRFHKILPDSTFGTATLADQAACDELAKLADVDADGVLVW